MKNVDSQVLRYRESEDPREKNKLFIEIREIYMNRVKKIASTFPSRYYDEALSLYDGFVLRCIDNWDEEGDALFSTYLYIWAGQTLIHRLTLMREYDCRCVSLDLIQEQNEYSADE